MTSSVNPQNPALAAPLDSRSLGVATLAVTAAVLFVGLIIVLKLPAARAAGQNDRAGDYIMVTHQISSSMEAVTIIDAASQQMNVYGFDMGPKQLKILQRGIPLDQLPGRQVDNP